LTQPEKLKPGSKRNSGKKRKKRLTEKSPRPMRTPVRPMKLQKL
jgi:hypothetical protein